MLSRSLYPQVCIKLIYLVIKSTIHEHLEMHFTYIMYFTKKAIIYSNIYHGKREETTLFITSFIIRLIILTYLVSAIEQFLIAGVKKCFSCRGSTASALGTKLDESVI